MADDEPMADAPAEQVAAAPAPAPAAAAQEEAAPAEAAAAPAAAAAAPPSTAKKAAAPASTKKKAAAKPASTPASTPARAGRERKKVEFFSPPQAVVKEDLVQVKVRGKFISLSPSLSSTNQLFNRKKSSSSPPCIRTLAPSFSLFFNRIAQGKGTKLSEISNSEYESVAVGEKRRRKERFGASSSKKQNRRRLCFFLTVDFVVFARAR